MLMQKPGARQVIALMLISAAIMSCNLQAAAPSAAAQATGTAPSTATVADTPASAPTQSPVSPVAIEAVTSTATSTQGPPPVVTVSAVGGRLNVRRGPGPEYNTVGALREGQSSVATARNSDGSWVLINTPNTSKSLGWITLKTKYTSVGGTVEALPVMAVEAAVPAYVRNCTPHEMMLNPGGSILPDRSTSPDNQLQIAPGDYTVMDWTTETDLGSISIFEGTTVDIKQDSSGTNFVCP
ncbi:MAG TPA: SH3 domain-containing protein [Anaerolineales bacterium]